MRLRCAALRWGCAGKGEGSRRLGPARRLSASTPAPLHMPLACHPLPTPPHPLRQDNEKEGKAADMWVGWGRAGWATSCGAAAVGAQHACAHCQRAPCSHARSRSRARSCSCSRCSCFTLRGSRLLPAPHPPPKNRLLNIETVKLFGAERFELGAYGRAIDAFQARRGPWLAAGCRWLAGTRRRPPAFSPRPCTCWGMLLAVPPFD